MSKNTNLSFLTDFITADIVNSRVGINNASPQTTFDVTGTGKFSGILTLGSTISNGTYAYTLPSATGTLALTSDIPSVTGYVPYTGATQAVNLGYNSLSASFLRIDGAGPTLGSYLGFKHSTNVTTGADGYTSIYTFGTNTIAFKSVSGATTRDFSFSMASITPGVPGGRTYTLPDADGTIALTSNIPANPVGGTGTSGTIPVFTGSTTIGNSIIQSNATQVNIVGNGSQLLFDSLGSTKNGGIQYINDFTLQISNSRGTGSSINLGDINLDFNTNVSANPKLRITAGGNVLIGTTTDSGAKLEVAGGGVLSLLLSGNITDATRKFAFIEGKHYTNSEEPIAMIGIDSQVSSSILYIGGGLTSGLNAATSISFQTAANNTTVTGTERMCITSVGQVGIGTSNPVRQFVISNGGADGIEFTQLVGSQTTEIITYNRSTSLYTPLQFESSVYTFNRGNLLIGTTTDNGARLQVSGRVSATGNDFHTLAVQEGSAQLRLERTVNSTGVAYLGADSTGFSVFNSSFTRQFTITSSGNVGIGTSSPATTLEVFGANVGEYLRVGGGTISARSLTFSSFDVSGLSGVGHRLNVQNANGVLAFDIGGTERMRITSGGDVRINHTIDFGATFSVKKTAGRNIANFSNQTDADLNFTTSEPGATPFARITPSVSGQPIQLGVNNNNVLLGTTTDTGARLNVGGSYDGYPVSIEAGSGGNQLSLTRGGAVAQFYMGGSSAGATQFYIRAGGSGGVLLSAGSTGWVSASDIRLKDVTKPIENAVESLSSLQTIYYSWKDSINKNLHIGLIAQEVEKVFPELVSESSIDGMKGVNYTELIPVIIKAIQELNEKINR